MLNCILGMVEKTQSALTILQQRQSEAANLRTTEEAVADVQVSIVNGMSRRWGWGVCGCNHAFKRINMWFPWMLSILLRLERTWQSWRWSKLQWRRFELQEELGQLLKMPRREARWAYFNISHLWQRTICAIFMESNNPVLNKIFSVLELREAWRWNLQRLRPREVREVVKKKVFFTVRLTIRVDSPPPPYGQGVVIFSK